MTKKNSSISTLKNWENLTEDDSDKAALLNNYFSQCFNWSVPPLTDDDLSTFGSINPLQCPEELLCTEDKVFEMLSSLDTKKANGWETFQPQCWGQLLQVLHTVSHCSLTNPSVQGKYPKAWKMSPIPKGSDSTSVSNYRPVSVLPVISKLLERHMHSLISCHIETFYPIASHQWGFQPGKSAVSAQINILHN